MRSINEYINEAAKPRHKRPTNTLKDTLSNWAYWNISKSEEDDFTSGTTFQDVYDYILEMPIVYDSKSDKSETGLAELIWSNSGNAAFQRQQLYRALGKRLNIKGVNGTYGGVDYDTFFLKVKATKLSESELLKQFTQEFDMFEKDNANSNMKYSDKERKSYVGKQDFDWMNMSSFVDLNRKYFKDDALKERIYEFAEKHNYKISE